MRAGKIANRPQKNKKLVGGWDFFSVLREERIGLFINGINREKFINNEQSTCAPHKYIE